VKWIRQRPVEILLFFSILACVFEGACRKWIFREVNGPITYSLYFAKDIIFFAIVMLPGVRNVSRLQGSLKRIFSIALPLILVGASISAVRDINFVGSLLSFRALIALPLLAYFTLPRLTGIRIEKVALVIGALTMVNAVLGVVQNTSPVDATINYYTSGSSAAAFEQSVRAAGTFSYISGYANLATVGCWSGLVLLALAAGRLSYIIAGWTFYLSSLVCALVSISRGVVITVLLMLLVLAISGKNVLGKLVKGISGLGAILLIGYAFNLNQSVAQWTDIVLERHEASEETIEGRTLGPIMDIVPATELAPGGLGFGSEQVAGVFADTGAMNLRLFENQFPRLILETGLIGFAGFLITCSGVLYVMLKARKYVPDDGHRMICVLSAFLVASFFFTNIAFNHIASFFAWIIVAVTLASLPMLSSVSAAGKQYAGRMVNAKS